MMLKRIIPVILVKDGLLVRSQVFRFFQAIGDPIPTIKRLSDWNIDELILLNIGSTSCMDSRRDDKWHSLGSGSFPDLVHQASKFCFCPLAAGGNINTLDDFSNLFKSGADKCVINTLCFSRPELVCKAVALYGSQSIVASIDVKQDDAGMHSIYINKGKRSIIDDLHAAVKHVLSLGVGEIMLNSINNDGLGLGYNDILYDIASYIKEVPVIINGGAAKVEHFKSGLVNSNISGVAASNFFYFRELSYPLLKKQLIESGLDCLRQTDIGNEFLTREPLFDSERKATLLRKLDPKNKVDPKKYDGHQKCSIRYCTRCLYPSLSATPMEFDESGVCMGCRVSDIRLNQDGERYRSLENELLDIVNVSKRKNSEYDCIVSVSGGKDSYYQVHYVVNVLKLKPLLVTYNGNNYSQIGWRNLWRMREVFDCDHIIISPSVNVIKKLNRIAFVVMGDMSWHAHVGIFTTAPRIAIQQNIPLIFWGEHGYTDLCGQFSMSDFPEMNYRERTEHAGRGFDWPFFVGLENLSDSDLNPWKYPNDAELMKLGLRQVYLGNYIPWESNEHLELVTSKYQFEVSSVPFERTYRIGSNLDDIHENGVHDYLKYIKFGYGRCTDHASKDIRAGLLSRQEGIRLVNRMDPVKPSDLNRWLDYVGMSESEFDRIADHFRDPRVWSLDSDGRWQRDLLKH